MKQRNRWYKAPGDRLWISSHGSPLTEMALFDIVTKRTKAAFGRAINPHLFRDAAATTVAIHDPASVRIAAPLLGHRTFSTTERHYIQAKSLQAHREFSDKITALRQSLRRRNGVENMTELRAVIYARYSSDLQREASIEDQVRECERFANQMGWSVDAVYSDAALSGSIEARPGLQALLSAVKAGSVDVVVAEALDRVSRDQEHVARIFKHLTFSQVALRTLAEGEVSELHVGLKGTMNAIFLKDLAAKIRRGQRGRALSGRSPGGLPYGYDVIRQFGADGRPENGLRSVNDAQAAVVRRIFEHYADGMSARQIAKMLNSEGVPSARLGFWNASSIIGNRARRDESCGTKFTSES